MINDPIFWVLLFTPVPVYWLLPEQYKSIFLPTLSLLVIAFYDILSCAILIALAITVYFGVHTMNGQKQNRGLFTVGLIALLAIPLISFKAGLFIVLFASEAKIDDAGDVLVPLGMSYYIFRLLHVVIEAYRNGKLGASFQEYISYAFLFTIIPAGPIQRLDLFKNEREMEFHSDHLLHGLTRISYGLIKQVLVVGYALDLRNKILTTKIETVNFEVLSTVPSWDLWIIVITAYLVSLLNLSAYTDIAIGGSRLYGIKISENFHYPVFAFSIQDFWRRWHITLSGWCFTYIYTPVLGWSRNPYMALIASFQVMALWHAFSVNRIWWGLFHAFGVILSTQTKKIAARRNWSFINFWPITILTWLLTQAFVSVSWVFVLTETTPGFWSGWWIVLRLFGA